MNVDISTTCTPVDDLSNVDQSNFDPLSPLLKNNEQTDQPLKEDKQRNAEFGDDSHVEFLVVDQQCPDDAAISTGLQSFEDQYVEYVTDARATLEKVRATLNQPDYTDSEKLCTYLPILEAAKRNLTNTSPELTPKTVDEGKRVLELIVIIHSAIAHLNEMMEANSSQNFERRWIIGEYIQLMSDNYESVCIAEELVGEHLVEPSLPTSLIENFMDILSECRDEFNQFHFTVDEEPFTSPPSESSVAAGISHPSPDSSGKLAEKRKSKNYLNSSSSNLAKRFCSDDTDADC